MHGAGFGGFPAQGECGQGVGPQVDGEDLHDGERERDRPAGQGEDQEGKDLGDGVGEDVEDELADVVVDTAAGLDGRDDGGEVVVGEHHRGGFPGDVGAGAAHGDPDVGPSQRGCVVDTVAGHGDDLALGAQRVGDAELGFRCAAGEDHFAFGRQELIQFRFGEPVEFGAGDDVGLVVADADLAGDRRGGRSVVTGDYVHADAGLMGAGDGVRHLRPGRVGHGDQAEQAQVAFGFLALGGDRCPGGELTDGDGQDAQPGVRVVVHGRGHGGTVVVGQRACAARMLEVGAPGEHFFGCALGVHREDGALVPVVLLVHGGHELDP